MYCIEGKFGRVKFDELTLQALGKESLVNYVMDQPVGLWLLIVS